MPSNVKQSMFYLYSIHCSCRSNLCLIPRNRRSKHGPQQQVLRGPIKSAERPNNCGEAHHWPQCYSFNNWISRWCKVSSFHWTTLMQDTLDIIGVGCEYDFVCLYTGYFIQV